MWWKIIPVSKRGPRYMFPTVWFVMADIEQPLWSYLLRLYPFSWWRHQMETFSALLAICAGNSPIPVNSPHKGQSRGALLFTLICVWINGCVNNREADDLRRYCAHYGVTVMLVITHGNFKLAMIYGYNIVYAGQCDSSWWPQLWFRLYHHILSAASYRSLEKWVLFPICAIYVWNQFGSSRHDGLIRLFAHCTISLSFLSRIIWKYCNYEMLSRHIMSNVCLRLSPFCRPSLTQFMGLGVFSLPCSLSVTIMMCVLHLIITIKSEIWITSHG